MKRAIALSLTLLALGIGAWALWGDRFLWPESERVAIPDSVDASAPETASLAAGGRKPQVPVAAVDATPSAAADPEGRAVGAGTKGKGGAIRGRVLWAADRSAVPGARVTLTPLDPIAVALRVDTRNRADTLAVRTDASGRFELANVRRGTDYVLTARGPSGPVTRMPHVDLGPVDGTVELEIPLQKSGPHIRGFVHDPEGAPIPGARVVVAPRVYLPNDAVLADPDRLPEREAEARTDDKGRFWVSDLAAGTKSVVVVGPNGACEAFLEVEPTIDDGGDLDVRLVPPLAISGRVVYASGEPAPGISVFAKSVSRATAYDAVTGTDGSFRIPGPSHGPYFVAAMHPGLGGHAAGIFPAGHENVRITLPEGGAVEARVVWKRDGAPVTDFQWILEPQRDEGDEPQWREAWVDDAVRAALGPTRAQGQDGRLRIDSVRTGKFVLRIYVDGHASVASPPFEVRARSETRLEALEVAEAWRVHGVVRTDSGAPVAGARIIWAEAVKEILEIPEEELPFVHMTGDLLVMTDAHGNFTCEPVAPGEYSVIAIPPKGRPAVVHGVRVRDADVAALELVLPPSAALRVRVLTAEGTPAPRTLIFLAQEGGLTRTQFTADEPGPPVVLDGLRPGAYAVAAWAWAGATPDRLRALSIREVPGAAYEALASLPDVRTIHLAGGQEIALDLRLPRLVRLRLHLRPPSGVNLAGFKCELRGRQATVDELGTAELDLLEPGAGVLRVVDMDVQLGVLREFQGSVTVPDVPFAELDVAVAEPKK